MSSSLLAAVAIPLLAIGLATPPLAADSAGEQAEPVLRIFPTDDPYPVNTADPRRPGFGLLYVSVVDVGIADSGSSRFYLKLGARFGLLRYEPRGRPGRALQLGLVGGLDAMFDIDQNYDNIGWDGNYGLVLSAAAGKRLAWKIGIVHTSSHIGDELIERTGRQRIDYTREEAQVGLSWRFRRLWRAYLESGWGYVLRNEELQEPGRAQIGIEFESPRSLGGGRWGWYVAGDLAATEERDWRIDTTAQVGLVTYSGNRRWRLAVELHDGAPPLGEFFQDTEQYVTAGLWMDLQAPTHP